MTPIESTSAVLGESLIAFYNGSETVTFHWKKDNSNVSTDSNIYPYEGGGSYTAYYPNQEGSYTVTVSAAGYQSKTSAAVAVTQALILGGTITISPETAVTGTKLTATYTGTETVTFQWKDNSNKVVSKSNKYTPTEAGRYTVTVSAAGYQSKISDTITVALILSGNITISGLIGPGKTAVTGTELTAGYTGTETVTYQWKDASDKVVSKSNKYTPTEAGSYTVTVSAVGYPSKTSDTIIVSLVPPSKPIVYATPLSSGDIDVSWETVPAATSYDVYYSTSVAGRTFMATVIALDERSFHHYMHTGVQYDTVYYYSAVAKNDAGSSDYGTSGSATRALSAPSITSATKSGMFGVSVSWNSVAGAKSYDVYYQIGNTSATMQFAKNVTETSCYFDAGFSGYVYVYIKAKNNTRTSDYSKYAVAKP